MAAVLLPMAFPKENLACGDVDSVEVDHAALASKYTAQGNHECALKHRLKDAEIFDDAGTTD